MKIQRGRDYSIPISLYDNNGNFIELTCDNYIAFGVKKKDDQTEYNIYQQLTADDFDEDENSYILELTRTVTNLPSGTYYYDIVLMYDNKLLPVVEYEPFVVKKAAII